MRIAYICGDNGIPVFGDKGAAIHVRELSQALQVAGHGIELFATRLGGERPPGYDVPVHDLGLERPERTLLAALANDPRAGDPVRKEIRAVLSATTVRLSALPRLRAFRPDAIYERYSLLGTAGGELARMLGVPHILEVNAPLSEEHATHRGTAWPQTVRDAERRILTSADHIITVSASLRDWVVRQGVEPARVTPIANGVDVARFAAADGSAIRTRFGLGVAPVIGFTGTLKGWHGTPALARAFVALVRQCRTAGWSDDALPRLLIVGDGPQREEIEAILAGGGVAGLVTITGMVPHATVPDHVAAMDIAVAPYEVSADFYFSPLKLYEYLAAGRAVVASRIGQCAEAIVDGRTGLLTEPGDTAALTGALGRLVGDPALRHRLGEAGRQSGVAGPWAAIADRVVGLADAARSRPVAGRVGDTPDRNPVISGSSGAAHD